jgi:hypothetical protein
MKISISWDITPCSLLTDCMVLYSKSQNSSEVFAYDLVRLCSSGKALVLIGHSPKFVTLVKV